MALQELVRDRQPQAAAWLAVPITKTISGSEGARIITGATGGFGPSRNYAFVSNATVDVSMVVVYYAGVNDYDPEFVTSILQADAAAPEASFDTVVDMLDWLNRD